MKPILLIAILIIAAPPSTPGQETSKKENQVSKMASTSQKLYNEIVRMDNLLFAAFNTQNLDELKIFFTDDLEFYQDNEGLASYSQTIKDFKAMFEQNLKIKRELVKGSLEVYPIKDYGAIEIGVHKFCHIENGKDDCGTFKFTHVWQRTATGWKISRVISYGH